jgi:hypothetical protein
MPKAEGFDEESHIVVEDLQSPNVEGCLKIFIDIIIGFAIILLVLCSNYQKMKIIVRKDGE